MKNKLLNIVTAVTLLTFPNINFAQVTLGANASKFALFTYSGAIGDNASAHSHVTGGIGTDGGGLISGFGNVNGVMHPGSDIATAACISDLNATISQINAMPATLTGPLILGNGYTVTPGASAIQI